MVMKNSLIKRRGQPKRKLTPIQQRRLIKISIALLVFFLTWMFFAPGSGLLALWKKRVEVQILEEQNRQLEATNAQLQQEIDKLQNDPAYLEEVARRQHNLLKKNERVFEFAPKKSAKEQ
jgi:cell division protein FtsB